MVAEISEVDDDIVPISSVFAKVIKVIKKEDALYQHYYSMLMDTT